MGRPSKIHKINLDDVTFYTEKGYTDKQLAEVFDVTEQTINNWKKDYPEFFESLKTGKLLADSKVEASLFQRACGYSHPEIHISNYLGSITKTPIIKHYPPDATSMIFWLKNRRKDKWRDVRADTFVEQHTHFTTIDVKSLANKGETELIDLIVRGNVGEVGK